MARSGAVLLRAGAGRGIRCHRRSSRDGDIRLGVIPVEARIGESTFNTSLFPKDGGYLLPLKNAVRRPRGLVAGDDVTVELTVRFHD